MLKRLKAFFKNLFKRATNKGSEWAPFKGQGAFGIPLERQIIKRTHFKPGESYRLGEMVVTVHANKESMLAAIAAVDAKREAKHALLTKRAEDIMLMSPEELNQFQLNEWIRKRKATESTIRRLLGRFIKDKSFQAKVVKHEELPPKQEQLHLVSEKQSIKDKEKIR